MKSLAYLSVLSVAGISAGHAVTVINFSFEDPDVAAADVSFAVTGWGIGADVGIINDGNTGGPGTPPQASNGTQIAFLGNGTNFTNIFQDVTGAEIGGTDITSYVFTISLAIRAGFGETPGTNGTIDVGIQDLTGTGVLLTTQVLRSSLNSTAFQDFSVTLPAATVQSGDAIRIFLDKRAGNSLIIADNARLTAIPEPSAALLGVFGLLGLLRRRR